MKAFEEELLLPFHNVDMVLLIGFDYLGMII